MPDEVYAFYIQLHLLNGSYTDAYHIPGRAAQGTEEDTITPQQIADYGLEWTENEEEIKQFHVFNSGDVRITWINIDKLTETGYQQKF